MIYFCNLKVSKNCLSQTWPYFVICRI